jgi:hypothetical protein
VQTILALIFAYLVFVTRTWAITRFVILIDVGLAMLFDFTPLRVRFGIVEPIALALTLALWVVNLLVDRRPPSDATSYRSGGR